MVVRPTGTVASSAAPPAVGSSDTNPNLTVDEIFAGFDSSIHNMSIAAGFGEENFMAAHVVMAYHYGLEMRA